MFCTLGVTRTPTTLLGGSAGVAGMDEGCDGVSNVDSVKGPVKGSVERFVGESVDPVMTELVAVEVDGDMLVTSSPLVLLMGPACERHQLKGMLLFWLA